MTIEAIMFGSFLFLWLVYLYFRLWEANWNVRYTRKEEYTTWHPVMVAVQLERKRNLINFVKAIVVLIVFYTIFRIFDFT